MITEQSPSVDRALAAFRQLMHALQVQRARRGVDPWSACPLTMPQLRALSLIASRPNGLSSRELAALLGVGASAITPLVDRLAERGLVRRTEDVHDRRVARLYATDAGAAAIEHMLAGQGDVLREALDQLHPDQLDVVITALDLLFAAVEQRAAA
jgi:DNA-binding MarR family transcriptional regulator